MWMLTPEGMFSAVVHDGDRDAVQVRTRSKEDALRLATWLVANDVVTLGDDYPTAESLVLEWKGRDYPCRLLLWREQWAAYVEWSVEQITYRNFKNEVKKRQGDRRASIYGRVWGVLLDITREHQPQPKATAPRTWQLPHYAIGQSRLWDDLHDEFPSLGSEIATSMSLGDTDVRCPRCDKFLSDVGVIDGDCKVCVKAMDEAIEREDWDAVQQISSELGLIADQP